MRRLYLFMMMASVVLAPRLMYGATATFVPVGPTNVPPGTDVVFALFVAAPVGFDAADIVIGSDDATDLEFVYSEAFTTAFSTVTTLVFDPGFYTQDLFAGGNNATSVGTSMLVGTVTIKTAGMANGTYPVSVDHALDSAVSALWLASVKNLLSGSASFTIQCADTDTDCDGDVDLLDFADLPLCMTGPDTATAVPCDPQDTNGDGRVDLKDACILMRQFTGTR